MNGFPARLLALFSAAVLAAGCVTDQGPSLADRAPKKMGYARKDIPASPITLIFDGVDLFNACSTEMGPQPTVMDAASFVMTYSACMNFIFAVVQVESRGHTRQTAPFCPPENQSFEAVRKALVDWMNGRADWHLTRASSVVHVAVSERFPCPR